MSVKVMIIDGQAEFRSLLMHHVTTHWPDAMITAYDPVEAEEPVARGAASSTDR